MCAETLVKQLTRVNIPLKPSVLKHVVGPTAAFVETTTLTATAAVGTTETDSWVDKDYPASHPKPWPLQSYPATGRCCGGVPGIP